MADGERDHNEVAAPGPVTRLPTAADWPKGKYVHIQYMCVCLCVYTHTCLRVHMCVHVCAYTCVCACVYPCVCPRVYIKCACALASSFWKQLNRVLSCPQRQRLKRGCDCPPQGQGPTHWAGRTAPGRGSPTEAAPGEQRGGGRSPTQTEAMLRYPSAPGKIFAPNNTRH